MEIAGALIEWYDRNARSLPWRESGDPYAVWVSEIMLQQTRVQAVLSYYKRWMDALPDIASLAAADEERLHKLWEGLGYYSRARNLRRAAIQLMESQGGRLPGSFEQLRRLPGVGDYTAGAIASIAFNEAVPAVDGNVLRVWARLTDDHRDVLNARTKRDITEAVRAVLPAASPGKFNAALMELGETVCLPSAAPLCARCPLASVCLALARGTAPSLPLRAKKKPRRIEYKTVFVLTGEGGQPAVLRRPDTGLLAGLWQLPERAGLLDAAEAAGAIGGLGARLLGELAVYERKHAFTHVEWRMRVYHARAELPLPEGWRWLDGDTALPTAYRVCLPEL
ncbi:MAG: A/G-specific adenine glycosylase [Clostridia bacterium]|nr:A/G-specific adenine glycosylase [Clostridia bacterium]